MGSHVFTGVANRDESTGTQHIQDACIRAMPHAATTSCLGIPGTDVLSTNSAVLTILLTLWQ